MLRTKSVKLKTIPAMAFRIKTAAGPSITIQRADYEQPGIASISRTSGKPIISGNTNLKYYPEEAFEEAIALTNGLTYKRGKGTKVTKEMVKDKKVKEPEEVIIDSADYQKIIDLYSDKNGKLSYDLINKDFIRFAKSSSVVKKMIEEGTTAAKVRNYVVANKIRNITGNHNLEDKQIKKIVELLDETYAKGVFKELNDEIRKMLSANKKKQA
ncbi:MAG: hypothetical protein IKS51_04210 [Erysipelotrichaceae bacterium]|nr:hypothetical protein [Erysipelotrichaceae bacterium]